MSDPVQRQSIQSQMLDRFADRLTAVEVVHTHESGCEVRTTYHLQAAPMPTASDIADLVEQKLDARLSAVLAPYSSGQGD